MKSTDSPLFDSFSSAVKSGDLGKAYSVVSSCDSTDPAGLYLRGLMRCAGCGTKADVSAGIIDLETASDAGFAPASNVSGDIRSGADGITDILKLRIRAEACDLDACREIFPLYDTGKNADGSRAPVRKDHAEAVRLYMPCAEAGDHVAQETIGYMYLMGFYKSNMGMASAVGLTLLVLVLAVNLIQLVLMGFFKKEA